MTKRTYLHRVTNILFVLFFTVALLAGCSQKNHSETKYYDKDFISSLEKGLQSRWDINKASSSKPLKSKEALTKSVNAEFNTVKPYKNKRFKDDKLHEQVITYLNALEDQKKALEHFEKSKYITEWNKAYNTRTEMLLKINSKYKLTVASKYQPDLDKLIRNGDAVVNKNNKRDAVNILIKAFKFEKSHDNGYIGKYTAIVKNTSGYAFKTFNAKVKLIDSNKTVVQTRHISADAWDKDQTNQFEFTTDKEFSTYEIVSDFIE
ncbi:hypothetical protein ACFP1L_06640 [Lactiplantibacillus nangangensis]|uniref:Lipoprotein n=1 Tax=Lactiplantibacillus nangangensis TaxID=2559917 RepID=A0ABW1SJP2_9LACO|nr:hypothetical protein [Lactiplantibacillus nangangensis]